MSKILINKANKICILILKLILLLLLFYCPIVKTKDVEIHFNNSVSNWVSSKNFTRKKRYLAFTEGSNIQLVYCLTTGAYGRGGDLVIGLTSALAWELPSNIDFKLMGQLHRHTRSIVYPKIETFLNSIGFDGRSCVMRALCEVGQRKDSEIGKGTFVQELLSAVFALKDDGTHFSKLKHRNYDKASKIKDDCHKKFTGCQNSLFDFNF